MPDRLYGVGCIPSIADPLTGVESLLQKFCGARVLALLGCNLRQTARWPIRRVAKLAVFEFMASWYNQHRRHSTMGYLSPADVERRTPPVTLAASKLSIKLG